jgi:hypothetical protein
MGGSGEGFLAVAWVDQSPRYTEFTNPGAIQCQNISGVDEGCLFKQTMGDLGHWYPGNTCQDVVNGALGMCRIGPISAEEAALPVAGPTFFGALSGAIYSVFGGNAY